MRIYSLRRRLSFITNPDSHVYREEVMPNGTLTEQEKKVLKLAGGDVPEARPATEPSDAADVRAPVGKVRP
jgi:hypothetical protein